MHPLMIQGRSERPCELTLAGERYRIGRAALSIQRATRWPRPSGSDAGVVFMLELQVDGDAGEDGAPAPTIQSIPVREAFGRWPRLDELPGLVVDVPDDALWDAWYGNDAPPLEGNRLAFGSWAGSSIEVHWMASWDLGRNNRGDGPVELAGIRLHIFEDEPIEGLIAAIWGDGAPARFEVARLSQLAARGAGPSWRPADMPETVSYELWPRFLGPRPT